MREPNSPTDLDAAIGLPITTVSNGRFADPHAVYSATFSAFDDGLHCGVGATRYDAILDLLFQVQPAPVTP